MKLDWEIIGLVALFLLGIIGMAKASTIFYNNPINTSVIPSSYPGYSYQVAQAPYGAYFKNNSNLAKAVMVISNDYQFSFDIATSQAQWYNSSLNAIMGNSLNPLNTNATIMDNALTYPNAWSGTNLTYTLTDSEVKETLAINSTPSAVGTADFFRYKINVYYNSSLQVCFDNGTCYLHPSSVKVNTTGAITFEDANNKTVFYLPPPNVTDSVGNSVNATYFLSLNNGVDLWYLSIPKSFISTAVYPIYLDPTVTFSTGSVGNMRAAVVDDTHFGLAWDISGTKYLEFYNTNGTNSTPVITVEGSAGATQFYDIDFSCGNSTLCAYTWYNFNSDNSKLQFFDNTGANVSPMLTIQHVVNSLQITHTFLNSSDVEVCFHSVPGENCTQYHYAGNGLTPTYVGSSMAMASVGAAGTPVRCKVDAFNSSAYVLGCGLYTAQQINVTALTTSGTVLMANTQIESTGGALNPTWVSTDNWQNFTVLWHNTITHLVKEAKYTSAGTQILAPTTVQGSTGNIGDVMSGWFNSTNSLLGWYLGGTPYDFSFGNYVTAGTGTTYKVDNSSTGTTMAAISGQQAVNLRFCSANDTVNQYLVYVYGNSTSLNAWTSYYSNGTAWNGTCPAAVATTYYVATTNLCGFNTTTVAACGSGWTTTFCTAGNYYPTQACSATPTFSACQAESAANSCGVCGNCAGGADTCSAVACGTTNSYGCGSGQYCSGGVGIGSCNSPLVNGSACNCTAQCITGLSCVSGFCSGGGTINYYSCGNPLTCTIPSFIPSVQSIPIFCMPKSNNTGQPLTGLTVTCGAYSSPIFASVIQAASTATDQNNGIYNWTFLVANQAANTCYIINCSTTINTVTNSFAGTVCVMRNDFATSADVANILGNMSGNFSAIQTNFTTIQTNFSTLQTNMNTIITNIATLQTLMGNNFTLVLGNQTLILGNQTYILGNESTIISNIATLQSLMGSNFTYTNGQITLVQGNQSWILGNQTVIISNLANINSTQNANALLILNNQTLILGNETTIITNVATLSSNMQGNFTYTNGQILLALNNQTLILNNETDIKNLIAYLNGNMSGNFSYTNGLITGITPTCNYNPTINTTTVENQTLNVTVNNTETTNEYTYTNTYNYTTTLNVTNQTVSVNNYTLNVTNQTVSVNNYTIEVTNQTVNITTSNLSALSQTFITNSNDGVAIAVVLGLTAVAFFMLIVGLKLDTQHQELRLLFFFISMAILWAALSTISEVASTGSQFLVNSTYSPATNTTNYSYSPIVKYTGVSNISLVILSVVIWIFLFVLFYFIIYYVAILYSGFREWLKRRKRR